MEDRNYSFIGLSVLNQFSYNDAQYLLELHDKEVQSIIPDKNLLKILVSYNDYSISHSYFYRDCYMFSTKFTKLYNWWIPCKQQINISDILKYVCNYLKYPYSNNEIMWLYYVLNNQDIISATIIDKIDSLIESLNNNEKLILSSKFLILKLSERML